jgi:hypothetical protein
MSKIPSEFLIGIGSDAESPDMENFGIKKGSGVRLYIPDESADKVLRLPTARANKDSIAPMDMAEDLIL